MKALALLLVLCAAPSNLYVYQSVKTMYVVHGIVAIQNLNAEIERVRDDEDDEYPRPRPPFKE